MVEHDKNSAYYKKGQRAQAGAHLQRGWRNYHRKMSPLHKKSLLSLIVDKAYEVGTFVKMRSPCGSPITVVNVGKILKFEIVELKRTSKIYNPPKVHKYYVKWTYDTGGIIRVWNQHKLLEPITKKEYLKFFKKYKIKPKVK